jgi:anti-sigma factor RsiW
MSAYLDEELGSSGRTRFEQHVSECSQCRRLLAGLRATLEALHGALLPVADDRSRQVVTSVRQRLNEPPAGV